MIMLTSAFVLNILVFFFVSLLALCTSFFEGFFLPYQNRHLMALHCLKIHDIFDYCNTLPSLLLHFLTLMDCNNDVVLQYSS